jgi:2-dehydropantoate 2-reductase
MGSGGIGGIIAASLTEHRRAPTVVTHNLSIAAAINAGGFVVQDGDKSRAIAGHATAVLPNDAGIFDVVLLATQPPQVAAAARAALPHLHPDGVMVCLQNGLCEAHVAAVVGDERVVGAIVVWGASMPRPGVYERTSAGGVIGQLDSLTIRGWRRCATCCTDRRSRSHNLLGARWSKLALCAISSLGTIGGERGRNCATASIVSGSR